MYIYHEQILLHMSGGQILVRIEPAHQIIVIVRMMMMMTMMTIISGTTEEIITEARIKTAARSIPRVFVTTTTTTTTILTTIEIVIDPERRIML